MSTTLSFLGCVNIAVRTVRSESLWSSAELWEVRGAADGGKAVTDVREIGNLSMFFAVPKGTVSINSTPGSWGEFEKPVFYASPFLEDVLIKWPVELDLPEAHELMVRAGYDIPFTQVMLRHPLSHPPQTEASYIFVVEKFKRFIFVGVDSHEVHDVQF